MRYLIRVLPTTLHSGVGQTLLKLTILTTGLKLSPPSGTKLLSPEALAEFMVASQPSCLGRLPKDAIYLYSQIVKEQFTSLIRDLPRNFTSDLLSLVVRFRRSRVW